MKSLFEEMGGTYHQKGDYCIPNLFLPERAFIGIWGQLRGRYLRNYHEGLYAALLFSGRLDTHLAEIDLQATAMFLHMVKQLSEQEGVTEGLKVTDQITWVGRMNNIREQAEEIVNQEIIYA